MAKSSPVLPLVPLAAISGPSLASDRGASALEVVLAYHERTKHHPHRYATSLGYLDWANQPDPFRRYVGAKLTELPFDTEFRSPDYAQLYGAGAVMAEALSLESLSRFLRHSLALSAWKQSGKSRWALRVNPSSGNLHPTEGYLVLPPVEGLAPGAGVYHYAPKAHGLEHRASLNDDALGPKLPMGSEGRFFVGLTSIEWREAWKYGERAFRYCQHDLGHALAALRLAAAMLGWTLRAVEGCGTAAIGALLGVDRDSDSAEAEREEPELLAVVDTRGLSNGEQGLEPLELPSPAVFTYFGRANRLSDEHAADWPVIEEVSRATWSLGGLGLAATHPAGSTEPPRPVTTPMLAGLSAAQVILNRRSAVAMDGKSVLARADFYRMLARLLPCGGDASPSSVKSPPWDAIDASPGIQLLLFVHRVSGLESGLYALLRDKSCFEELRAALDGKFVWEKSAEAPAGLPLYLLGQGDFRDAAAALSCGQRIAADGAFAVVMLANFRRTLVEQGPSFYRRMFWEAGMIGQVLYLEAEASRLRGTGIGCYFDDAVHEVLGLTGDAWQSLYHFTLGGPVHDDRLQSQPPYDAATLRN